MPNLYLPAKNVELATHAAITLLKHTVEHAFRRPMDGREMNRLRALNRIALTASTASGSIMLTNEDFNLISDHYPW